MEWNAAVLELDEMLESMGDYEPLIAFPAGRDDDDPVDTLDALIASELFGM